MTFVGHMDQQGYSNAPTKVINIITLKKPVKNLSIRARKSQVRLIESAKWATTQLWPLKAQKS